MKFTLLEIEVDDLRHRACFTLCFALLHFETFVYDSCLLQVGWWGGKLSFDILFFDFFRRVIYNWLGGDGLEMLKVRAGKVLLVVLRWLARLLRKVFDK